jgi:hypothetical protein
MEAVIARQQNGKHISYVTDINTAIEDVLFLCDPGKAV